MRKKGRFSSKVRTRTNSAVSVQGAGSEGGCIGGNKEVKRQNIVENIRKLRKTSLKMQLLYVKDMND